MDLSSALLCPQPASTIEPATRSEQARTRPIRMSAAEFAGVHKAVRRCFARSPMRRRLGADRVDDVIGEVLLAIVNKLSRGDVIRDLKGYAWTVAESAIVAMLDADQETSEPSIYTRPGDRRGLGDTWLDAVRGAMARAGGSVPKAAELLGVSRDTVERALRELPDVVRRRRGRPPKVAA